MQFVTANGASIPVLGFGTYSSGKRSVRHHDRVLSLGIFEMAKGERVAVHLKPAQRDVG